MSIMDHDPKYTKLRAWREEREMRLWKEQLRRMREHLTNTLKRVPRKIWDGPAYDWKPTAAMKEQEHE